MKKIITKDKFRELKKTHKVTHTQIRYDRENLKIYFYQTYKLKAVKNDI